MMPAMGISAAITAIVGQNLGANNLRRAKDAVKKGVYLISMVIVPSMILTALFGKYITIFFIPKDPLVHQIGNVMFYIVSPSVVFFALTSVFNGAFQGAGFTIPVMATNLARIWVFRIPLVYFFSFVLLNGANDINSSVGIWCGMFFSNLFAFLMILVWYLKGNWAKSIINTK